MSDRQRRRLIQQNMTIMGPHLPHKVAAQLKRQEEARKREKKEPYEVVVGPPPTRDEGYRDPGRYNAETPERVAPPPPSKWSYLDSAIQQIISQPRNVLDLTATADSCRTKMRSLLQANDLGPLRTTLEAWEQDSLGTMQATQINLACEYLNSNYLSLVTELGSQHTAGQYPQAGPRSVPYPVTPGLQQMGTNRGLLLGRNVMSPGRTNSGTAPSLDDSIPSHLRRAVLQAPLNPLIAQYLDDYNDQPSGRPASVPAGGYANPALERWMASDEEATTAVNDYDSTVFDDDDTQSVMSVATGYTHLTDRTVGTEYTVSTHRTAVSGTSAASANSGTSQSTAERQRAHGRVSDDSVFEMHDDWFRREHGIVPRF